MIGISKENQNFSCVPPQQYAKRFVDFMKKIIVGCPK
jgi:hypothetical protein